MITDILYKMIKQSVIDTAYPLNKFIMNPKIEKQFRFELTDFSAIHEYIQSKTFCGIPIETDINEKNIRGIV